MKQSFIIVQLHTIKIGNIFSIVKSNYADSYQTRDLATDALMRITQVGLYQIEEIFENS